MLIIIKGCRPLPDCLHMRHVLTSALRLSLANMHMILHLLREYGGVGANDMF
jgi:hypothetical protein